MYELELLNQLKAGSQVAVRIWYEQYQSHIFSFVSSKISNQADVEELVQDIFLNALKQLPLFLGNSQLLTWMLSIARHEVADYYRKKYAKKVLQLLPLDCEVVGTWSISESETVELVNNVLTTLHPDHRELLLLKYIDGKSVAEIAKELKRSIKAIESDLFRARRTFRTNYLSYVPVAL